MLRSRQSHNLMISNTYCDNSDLQLDNVPIIVQSQPPYNSNKTQSGFRNRNQSKETMKSYNEPLPQLMMYNQKQGIRNTTMSKSL